mgnify:CR=1 FL=1
MRDKYFLKYQQDWLNDNSLVKIWEKSRRIGATYVQSYEDVRDCLNKIVPAVWFSSADESAAREYIIYCTKWAKLFNLGFSDFNESIFDETDIKTLSIKFNNGSRITALSSNPKAFRSKGGKIVLDEFAHHDNQLELWKAAKPTAVWGYPVRIISTHNGKKSQFYKFIEKIKNNKLDWSLHTTSIYDAVNCGLVDKILNKTATIKEKEDWIKRQKEDCFDEITWNEEFCCKPIDESTAFLSYTLINNCVDFNITNTEKLNNNSAYYCGFDIGRRKDLSVITILEHSGTNYILKMLKIFEKTTFNIQKEYLFNLLQNFNIVKTAVDETGIGMQLAEDLAAKFGNNKIIPLYFTNRLKEELAYNMLFHFQDRKIQIPDDNNLKEDLHSVQKSVRNNSAIYFDVNDTDFKGHADRFWSLALALYAAKNNFGNTINIYSKNINKTIENKYIGAYYV